MVFLAPDLAALLALVGLAGEGDGEADGEATTGAVATASAFLGVAAFLGALLVVAFLVVAAFLGDWVRRHVPWTWICWQKRLVLSFYFL